MQNLAILAYLLAIGIAVYLLRHFHSLAWYWHASAIAAAVGIALMPNPLGWNTPVSDLAFGSAILMLLVWGLGGLMFWQPHEHKHKHA